MSTQISWIAQLLKGAPAGKPVAAGLTTYWATVNPVAVTLRVAMGVRPAPRPGIVPPPTR